MYKYSCSRSRSCDLARELSVDILTTRTALPLYRARGSRLPSSADDSRRGKSVSVAFRFRSSTSPANVIQLLCALNMMFHAEKRAMEQEEEHSRSRTSKSQNVLFPVESAAGFIDDIVSLCSELIEWSFCSFSSGT